MKHGDLSNQAGHTLAFRCEDFLIEYREEGIFNKLMNTIVGKVKRANVNEVVRSYMEYIYRNTEYNVDLVLEEKNLTSQLKGLLDNMPFNRLVLIKSLSQISQRLNTGDLTYYVDDSEERRALVNHRYAVSLEKMSTIIKTGRV